MATKGRDKIKLESTAGTGHFYTTTKNKRTMPEKMAIMKFGLMSSRKPAFVCGFFLFQIRIILKAPDNKKARRAGLYLFQHCLKGLSVAA